ncbi:MAG: site-specific DNA-methyltransferase [Chitinophagaceae bacterium]|nr:site-specific DNA-methyltransferase [Rubrivivax sp.]
MSDNRTTVQFPAYKPQPVASLVPYARNARTHSDAQVAQIAASIRQFGFTNPILVDGQHGVIAGHGRLLAARQLGMTEVPTIELSHLTPAQRRAYVMADNRLALSAGWDDDMLRLELGELQAEGFDLAFTGFDMDEIATLLIDATDGLTDPDAVPEVPVDPVSRPDDLWLLGRHRLICGDSTDAAIVKRVLDGARPHLTVTDPPYGVAYDPAWRNEALEGSKTARVGKVLNDDRADWRQAWALFPGAVCYVWHGALHASTVADSLTACGFEIRSQIIWVKDRMVLSRGHYHFRHEPAWYAVRQGGTGHWSGDRKQTTIWQIASKGQDAEMTHGTQKPVECMRRPMENNSSPGQAVYEQFSGSGTTIIAAEMSGRVCHAIELSPAYVDVAVLRWQSFTGERAVLDGDGGSFATVAATRQPQPLETCSA